MSLAHAEVDRLGGSLHAPSLFLKQEGKREEQIRFDGRRAAKCGVVGGSFGNRTALAEETGRLRKFVVTVDVHRTTRDGFAISVIRQKRWSRRGKTSVQDAIQVLLRTTVCVNQLFTTNGAFASGASAVSLRGCPQTHVRLLFDGMRALLSCGDDGVRNVDLIRIPDDIVKR